MRRRSPGRADCGLMLDMCPGCRVGLIGAFGPRRLLLRLLGDVSSRGNKMDMERKGEVAWGCAYCSCLL